MDLRVLQAGPTPHALQLVWAVPCVSLGVIGLYVPSLLTADFTWRQVNTQPPPPALALLGPWGREPLSRLPLPEGLPREILDSAGFSHWL